MKEYIFFWNIENYSCCWHKNEEVLASPQFTADGMEGTVWILELFPRGYEECDAGFISIFLTRRKVDKGPAEFSLSYELSILGDDESTLCIDTETCDFENEEARGSFLFVEIEEVLHKRKCDYLPHDTLKVRCKIWWGEGPVQKIGESRARTQIEVKKISFYPFFKNSSALKQNESDMFEFLSPAKDVTFSSKLYLSDGLCCEEKIIFEIKSSCIKFISKCKLFLVDTLGNLIVCGPANDCSLVVENNFVKYFLILTKQVIMAREREFMTDDTLTLKCELTFSTGVEYSSIEEFVCEIPALACKTIQSKDVAVQKQLESFNALDNFKSLYINQFLTDVELKTNTSSYQAHKIVLCARSLVFKAMLSNDMKGKNCHCIKIEDLDDDILNQFLLFLYCDQVENLQWETAMKLYYASDKYEVKKLKVICSQHLQDNLTAGTAPKLLLLADTHSDLDLKQVVEDFILLNDVLVFGSVDWGNFIQTNPLLASKTMQLKYKMKN